MTRTAIIAAMAGELKPLVRGWKRDTRDGVDLWAHRDENLYIAGCAGAGQAAATRAFAAIESDAPIDLVFSVGWAGALTQDIAPRSAHNVAGGHRRSHRRALHLRCCAGDLWLVTSSRVADETEKRRLASTYGAALVDMEAAAVARLANMRGIPFYCVKGVSDALTDNLPDFNKFLADGKFQTGRFTLYALLRPWYWPALARMGENSKKASQNIAETLVDFLR